MKRTVCYLFGLVVSAFVMAIGCPALAGAPSEPLSPEQPMPQSKFTISDGRMPESTLTVTPSGTFGRATITVSIAGNFLANDIAQNYHGTAVWNMYVVAVVPGALLGQGSPALFVKSQDESWSPLQSSILPEYRECPILSSPVCWTIPILTNNDISSLTGTEIYLGVGANLDDLITNRRYRGIYKIP
jgi:hypothetical protein